MVDLVTFHFAGSMADDHKMNFYEAARFQYAAARLMVKLAQFRSTGSFVKKITNKSNFNIKLVSQSDGSFNINVEEPDPDKSSNGEFISVGISDLIAFVSERIVDKIELSALSRAVRLPISNAEFPTSDDVSNIDSQIFLLLQDDAIFRELPAHIQDAIRRRASELHRENLLLSREASLAKIDFAREQKLIAMSAPLISEMATALRRSADTLEIRVEKSGVSRPLLFLDQKMAQEIETAKVDEQITPILGDIVQYNKENGWGKFKFEGGTKIVSFNIPSDMRSRLQIQLIDQMKKDLVYLQTYFVRDRSGEVIRLIAVGVLPTPEI